MTVKQLLIGIAAYLVLSIIVAILTRATWKRIAGSVAGSTAIGPALLPLIALFHRMGLWHFNMSWEPYFLALMVASGSVCFFMYLLTWRIERKWGWRGLAVVLLVVAIIGPPRDSFYMRQFPEWGSYAPGMAPMLAISLCYVLMILIGHTVMRLVAGPSKADRLARRPWEKAVGGSSS